MAPERVIDQDDGVGPMESFFNGREIAPAIDDPARLGKQFRMSLGEFLLWDTLPAGTPLQLVDRMQREFE